MLESASTGGGWVFLADEWAIFTLERPRRVRYGIDGSWIERDLSAGPAYCSNDGFGRDPVPGIVKRCELLDDGSTTGTWTRVANEWGSFTLQAAARVRYGAGVDWLIRDLPAGVARCTNEFFEGDPIFGTEKRCEVEGGTPEGGGGTTPTPPAVVTDPSNQSVLVGQAATFTVAGSGSPTPTIQWQTRVAAAAEPDVGWTDVAGADSSSYTTDAVTLAHNGRQYRAVLRNVSGQASSTAATLTVTTTAVAPTITVQPSSQTVQAGNYGLFGVTASGTATLRYQWSKNGEPLVGETGSEVLVLAQAADAGGSYRISVRVSNAVGSVTSDAATMTIVAPPAGGGTVVTSQGGFVAAGTGAEVDPALVVPPGAVAGNTTISVNILASSVADLPAEAVPMGDVVAVGPPGLSFAVPARLVLPAPSDIPEGKVLALVVLEGNTAIPEETPPSTEKGASRVAPGKIGKIGNRPNLKRLIATQPKGGVVLQAIKPVKIQCGRVASLVAAAFEVKLPGATTALLAAVPEALCDDYVAAPTTDIPSDTHAPCTDAQYVPANAGLNAVLISRHVHCQRASAAVRLGNSGDYLLKWKIASDGAAALNKNYRVIVNLTALSVDPGAPPLSLQVRPVLACRGLRYNGTCSIGALEVRRLDRGATLEYKFSVGFSWSGGSGTWEEFAFDTIQLAYALQGQNIDTQGGFIGLSQPPVIRCDKDLAKLGSSGCVYAQKEAVYPLTGGPGSDVEEAAEHITDAQAAGSPGAWIGRSGGRGTALQRAKSIVVQNANRDRACEATDALIKTRLPTNQSPRCAAGSQTCSCDEYPFASTWSGARLSPDSTSVKKIKAEHNRNAGSGRLTTFYGRERVLDFTIYPDQVQPYDPNAESNRGGDNFWVHIR